MQLKITFFEKNIKTRQMDQPISPNTIALNLSRQRQLDFWKT